MGNNSSKAKNNQNSNVERASNDDVLNQADMKNAGQPKPVRGSGNIRLSLGDATSNNASAVEKVSPSNK